jgi:hypothetical protein
MSKTQPRATDLCPGLASGASASTLSRGAAATAACLLRPVPRIPDRRGRLLGAAWNVDYAAR